MTSLFCWCLEWQRKSVS